MSLVTCAMPVNYNDNNDVSIQNRGITKKNQTYKNRDTNKKIKKEMIESTYINTEDSSNLADDSSNLADDSSNLADFKPIQTDMQNKDLYKNSIDANFKQKDDIPIMSPQAFAQLNSTFAPDYYKQYTPVQSTAYHGNHLIQSPSIDGNEELLKKLDNILHLLEEQQEEQTNLITEELILYVFLGIFVIYVLDSFVRVGKYVR